MKKATYFYLLRRGFLGGGITPYVRNFGARVESDGGVYEKLNCVQQAISTLPAGPTFGVFTFGLFQNRVEADGGIAEGADCTAQKLNYMNANFTI